MNEAELVEELKKIRHFILNSLASTGGFWFTSDKTCFLKDLVENALAKYYREKEKAEHSKKSDK
jgi:hypothetical protein